MKSSYRTVMLCIGGILAILGCIEWILIAQSANAMGAWVPKDMLRAMFDFIAGTILLRIVSWTETRRAGDGESN